MEKIVVQIRRIAQGSPNFAEFANRTNRDDIHFLQEAFEISYKRAERLVRELGGASTHSHQIEVTLNYRQLGRYQAMRRRPVDLWRYWLAPNITHYESENEYQEEPRHPVELRPGIRQIP